MKKRFLVPLLCAAFICSAIAFTACDENDGGEEGEGSIVTADDWAKAMDFDAVDNFTFTVGSSDFDNTAIVKYDGLKYYWNGYWKSNENAKSERSADNMDSVDNVVGPGDSGEPGDPPSSYVILSFIPNSSTLDEGYYEITEQRSDEEGSVGKEYEKKNGAWTYKTVEGIRRFGNFFRLWVSVQFNDFTYDENKDCYVTDQVLSLSAEGVGVRFHPNGGEVQFKNKRVARIKFFIVEDIQHTIELQFFDYGTTVVTLPSVG